MRQDGENNFNWRGGKIKKICQFCKIEFYKFPSENNKFCSSQCYYKFRIGKKLSSEYVEKISGKNNHFYSKHHTEKTKQINREKHLGKLLGDKNPSKRLEVREKLGGKNCHFYKHGNAYAPYCSKFNRQKKEEIRNQYGRKCYICGKEEKDNILNNGKHEKLCVHHIDDDKEQGCNGKQWKLIPVCKICHTKTIKNKEVI